MNSASTPYLNSEANTVAWHDRLALSSRGKTRPPRTADDALLSTLQPDALKWIKTRRRLDSKAKVVISYARERQLREIFRGLDLQGVGVIDLKSLQKAAQYCEETTKGTVGAFKNIQAMFEGMDDDGNGEVDFAEFTGAMMGSTKSAVGVMSEQDIERLQRKFVEYAVENKRQHALRAIEQSSSSLGGGGGGGGLSHDVSSSSIKDTSDLGKVGYFRTLFGANGSKETLDVHDKLANYKQLRKKRGESTEDAIDEMIQEKARLFKLHENFIEEAVSPKKRPTTTSALYSRGSLNVGTATNTTTTATATATATTTDSIANRVAPKVKRRDDDGVDNIDEGNDDDIVKEQNGGTGVAESKLGDDDDEKGDGKRDEKADDDKEEKADEKGRETEQEEEEEQQPLAEKTKEYISIQTRIKAQRERYIYELKAYTEVRNIHKRIFDEKMFQLEMRRQHWNQKPNTARKVVARPEIVVPLDSSFKKELDIRRQAKEEARRLFGSNSPPKETRPLSPRLPPPSSAASYFLQRDKSLRVGGVLSSANMKSRNSSLQSIPALKSSRSSRSANSLIQKG